MLAGKKGLQPTALFSGVSGKKWLRGKISAEGEERPRCWMEAPLPIIPGASLLQTRSPDYSKVLCSLVRGGKGNR